MFFFLVRVDFDVVVGDAFFFEEKPDALDLVEWSDEFGVIRDREGKGRGSRGYMLVVMPRT